MTDNEGNQLTQLVIAALRGAGQRVTRQRLLILEALARLGGHRTADEVYAVVHPQDPTIHRSTVYRTLEFGVRLGLVTATNWENKRVFEFVHARGHHHLHCLQCGRIIELDDALLKPLRDALAEQYGFQAQLDHLVITGRCRICQAAHAAHPSTETLREQPTRAAQES
ncbi:MAG: transcriptional repressor [Thermorudis peleae]|nr:transcriptional repressor [Thermorudis peleae]